MKWYLKSAVLLLSTGLYFQPYLLFAQEGNTPSRKASDIEETSPANVSDQDSEGAYSRHNLCQIGKKLSKTTNSTEKSSLDSNAVGFNSPGDRNINKGVPFSKVLGSLAKDDNDKQSKAIKTEQSSNNCE